MPPADKHPFPPKSAFTGAAWMAWASYMVGCFLQVKSFLPTSLAGSKASQRVQSAVTAVIAVGTVTTHVFVGCETRRPASRVEELLIHV